MKIILGPRRPDLPSGGGWLLSGGKTLGKLLHLDKRGRHARVKPLPGGGAQIFLFTGVRYERDGTPLPSKPIGSPARAKRKRV
jgi:hypothetical protein